MTGSLIGTKLTLPPARELVTRPRLRAKLARVLECRLALVSAPAGFGKSTLVADWVRSSGIAASWVSLDQDDNDVARFLAYLAEAFHAVAPRAAATARHLLQVPRPISVTPALAALVNGTGNIPDDFILVLDDYHLIDEQAVHEALRFLLERLPPRVHLVVVTRADPPLPLARLRSRGEMIELRAADLRFTPSESEAFFNTLMGMDLPAEDVRVLTRRMEGWIAGMRLAAASLRGGGDLSDSIRRFGGSNRYVLDYLSEEVLKRQPEAAQSFLVRTSVLDRLCGPLCDALTGRTDGARTLRDMEAAGLFLEPLDEERSWYRYHLLFSDLLRSRLARLPPGDAAALHRTASVWLESQGMAEEAIGHALAARDFTRAAGLLLSVMEEMLMHCQAATLLRWTDALPAGERARLPLLCVGRVSAMLLVGKPFSEIAGAMEEAEASDPSGTANAELSAVKAFIAFLQEKPRESLALARASVAGLSAESRFLHSTVGGILGILSLSFGDMEAAQHDIELTIREARRVGNHFTQVFFSRYLARLAMMRGRLREAERLCLEAVDAGVDERGVRFPVVVEPLLQLADILLERNELARATERLNEAFALSVEWTDLTRLECHEVSMRLRRAMEDLEGALASGRIARDLAARFDITDIDDRLVEASRAALSIAAGEIGEAERWARDCGIGRELARMREKGALSRSYYVFHEAELLTYARLSLARGNPGESLAIAQLLLSDAETKGLWWSVLRILVIKALSLDALGRIGEAHDALEKALALGEGEGYIRVFVDEGSSMERLLGPAARQGPHAAYVQRILAAFPASTGGVRATVAAASAVGAAPAALVEPLSVREVQIVRLLAEGLSNKEIAERSFVAVQTVKWHTSNVYAKLGVKSRTQAVVRARALGIVQ